MTAVQPRWPAGSRALVVGEALVDVVVRPGAEPAARAGGSPMNVAIGLARLGAEVSLATRIGDDVGGRLIAGHLRDAGVHLLDGSVRPGSDTSSATATIGADGSASYDFDVQWDVDEPDPSGAALVHAGSIAAFLQPGADAVVASLAAAEGLTSFDANIRPALLGDPTAAARQAMRIAALVEVVKMSDEDAAWLHPGRSLEEVTGIYRDGGAALVVITRGGEGGLLRFGDDVVAVRAPRVAVTDTIGAGDSFMAGLLLALVAAGFSGRGDRAFSIDDATSAASFAAACAAVTVQRVGADLPTLADLRSTPAAGYS